MIEVELPDGSVAEFPDGTAPEVMKQAIGKRFPPQQAQQPQSPQMTDALAEMSAMTQNPARARYDALPAWQKPIVAAGDVVQLAGNAATFGYGEKAAAKARSLATGKNYEEELAEQRRLTQAARNRSGGAGVAAEVTGAIAAPLGLASKGLTLAGRGGTAAMTGAKGLAARTALVGAEGAGYGTLTAAGNDQDLAAGAGIGALGGAAGNVLGEGIAKGVGAVAGKLNPKPLPAPARAEIEAAKDAAYTASEQAGVIIKPQGIKHLADNAERKLADFGYDEDLHPGAKAALKRLNALQGKNVTLKGLDTIRKVANNGYILGNKANNTAVGMIVREIDNLLQAPNPNLMAGLNTREGLQSLLSARSLAHRASKMETAEKLILKGNQQADRNITDTRTKSVKSQLAKINDPFGGWGRGFNAAEKAAAGKAASYTPGQRALHGASVLNPFGGGKLSAAGHLAAGAANLATGNLPGLAMQGVGMAAGAGFQKASEALARKSVMEFVDLVARGGVPAPVVQNALQRLAKSKRDAISRALMALSVYEGAGSQQPAQ